MTALDGARRLPGDVPATPVDAVRSPGRVLAASLVYGILLCWVATIYVSVLVADGLSATSTDIDWWANVTAVALIAVTVEPVRRWLRLAVDDVVYGHHDDAYDVMTTLNRDLSTPSIAVTIARTFSVPYVSIMDGDQPAGVVGRRPAAGDVVDVPLEYQGETIGHMEVASRHPGTPLSARDMRLLSDLAHQMGVGMYAVRASAQVQASRAALVTAREEERRRIRRDLHDGLGPTLASMKLQLTAVQRLLDTDPARASAMLADVRRDVAETTAEIRRLVYGLRPPLIDELGLVAALRNHPASQTGLQVRVAADGLTDLPAAVEVALYRIAAEAIHNAARHSGGHRCDVTLTVTADAVHLSVADDGHGLPQPLVDGVGVSAMRERAAELGGAVTMAGSPTGTVVTTTIPLGAAR